MNARPFMLNVSPTAPGQQPGPVTPPPNSPHERRLPNGTQEGFLDPVRFAPHPERRID
jgi:hypothetical protein